jgi:hypothetical protein
MLAEPALAPAVALDQVLLDEVLAIREAKLPTLWEPDGLPVAVPSPRPALGVTGDDTSEPPHPGQSTPRKFAVLIAETLAGVRPESQLTPLLSRRGSVHLHRLLPLFGGGLRPRMLRVLTASPASGVIEMTLIVAFGPRTRALAVRLERTARARTAWRDEPAVRWLCTAIEAA